jgi:glycosyltransferase involved in cell wall biosynthesis
MTDTSLRLGLYYHTPSLENIEGLYMPGDFGCFVDSIAADCQNVICLLHEAKPSERAICNYKIVSSNVSRINLGLSGLAWQRTVFSNQYIQRAIPALRNLDAILIRGPSPLLPPLAEAVKKLPLVLLLVGDYRTGIDIAPQPLWRKELIRIWTWWNDIGQLRAAQHALTFVNSQKIYENLKGKVPNLHLIRTTTLSQKDFYERQDTCNNRPIRLLYTGRLSVSKGLFDIVEAMARLINQGHDLVLDLAGRPEPGEDDIVNRLISSAVELGIPGRLSYLGYKAFGPELFACYQRADIYVIASIAEGFPRTIWEAMANSLPVIATRVGSIPFFIEDAAELVQPQNVPELTAAISRLISDSSRRRYLIRKGQQLAQQNILENRAREMMDIISNYVKIVKDENEQKLFAD